MCAVTVTNQYQGPTELVADVESTADADVTAVIPHTFGIAPMQVVLVPLQVEVYTSVPIVSAITAAAITLTLSNAGGSGVAGDQIRVIARLNEDVDK